MHLVANHRETNPFLERVVSFNIFDMPDDSCSEEMLRVLGIELK